MKFLIVLSVLMSTTAFAQNNADIVCLDETGENSFQINTKTQQVWYNNSIVVSGPVFSGVNSSKNYVGEILAETTVGNTDYYITLIIRNINDAAQLEARWYPKHLANTSIRMQLDYCFLK